MSLGEPMEIARGYPFPIAGIRLRTGARGIHETTSLTLRIGPAGGAAVLEQALELDESDESDPWWYLPGSGLTAEQTALLTASSYRYVFVDADEIPVLEGAVAVRALPLDPG